MKILHTIVSVSPDGGGPIEGVRQLAKANSATGSTIEVASLDPPEAKYVADFPLPVHPLGPGLGNYRYSKHMVPWLRQNASRYDVIIVNGIWQYHSFATWRAIRHSSTPYILFTHGMLDPWFKRRYPMKHLKKWAYWPWAEYRVIRDAHAVIFTCDEEKMLARESFWLYSAKERVINYGTGTPAGNYDEQRRRFFQEYPDLEGKRLVLFLGRIHPKKGCDLAIQAFADVFRARPNWQLVIAGPDQVGWRRELEALAARLNVSDRITWTGSVAGDAKNGVLRAAEVFLLPSHQENFGIAVAEALACGTPVLISNKVNIWREVLHDGAGLVADDTVDGVGSLLRSWLNLPAAAQSEMRANATRCFESRFEIQRSLTSLLNILHDVTGKAGVGTERPTATAGLAS
jgi:glycosyltransferase involved in cell wall biosynthesis